MNRVRRQNNSSFLFTGSRRMVEQLNWVKHLICSYLFSTSSPNPRMESLTPTPAPAGAKCVETAMLTNLPSVWTNVENNNNSNNFCYAAIFWTMRTRGSSGWKQAATILPALRTNYLYNKNLFISQNKFGPNILWILWLLIWILLELQKCTLPIWNWQT